VNGRLDDLDGNPGKTRPGTDIEQWRRERNKLGHVDGIHIMFDYHVLKIFYAGKVQCLVFVPDLLMKTPEKSIGLRRKPETTLLKKLDHRYEAGSHCTLLQKGDIFCIFFHIELAFISCQGLRTG